MMGVSRLRRLIFLSRKEEYETRFEALVKPVTDAAGFELVDVEYVKEGGEYYLRAYIDKEGGITINDCEDVSRKVSDLLDKEDFIEDSYILEVSSPGLGRQLKKEKDYVRSIGKEIDVKLFKPLEKRKDFTGILKENSEESITLEEDGKLYTFNKKDISLARLTVRF
jgi:ribosome maturation factor RimP